MTCFKERLAAIPKLHANCGLTAFHCINAWRAPGEGSGFRLSIVVALKLVGYVRVMRQRPIRFLGR